MSALIIVKRRSVVVLISLIKSFILFRCSLKSLCVFLISCAPVSFSLSSDTCSSSDSWMVGTEAAGAEAARAGRGVRSRSFLGSFNFPFNKYSAVPVVTSGKALAANIADVVGASKGVAVAAVIAGTSPVAAAAYVIAGVIATQKRATPACSYPFFFLLAKCPRLASGFCTISDA